jgi:magnesium transporter
MFIFFDLNPRQALSIVGWRVLMAYRDDIVDSFFPLITRLEKRVDEIEDQVYTARRGDIQEFLFGIETTRRNVAGLIRLLVGKANILSTFEKHHSDKRVSNSENSPGHNLEFYIADVQDHVDSLVSKLRQFDSLLSRSRTNFVAALSIKTIRTRQRLVLIIGRVSAGTMIFTAITLVNGLFGTNVGNGDRKGDHKVAMYNAKPLTAFFAIGVGQVCLTILLLSLLRWRKWF